MKDSNRVVARTFVNEHGRTEAKSYSKHFYCQDGTLYSYSTPIAIWSWKLKIMYSQMFDNLFDLSVFPSDIIFLTDNRYSQTTGAHQAYLRYSGNGQVYEIPAEIHKLMNSPTKFLVELKEKIEECKSKRQRARKEYSKEHWQKLADKYNRLIGLFTPVCLFESLKWPERRS